MREYIREDGYVIEDKNLAKDLQTLSDWYGQIQDELKRHEKATINMNNAIRKAIGVDNIILPVVYENNEDKVVIYMFDYKSNGKAYEKYRDEEGKYYIEVD